MLYRTTTGELIKCNRLDYITDTEYYKAITAVLFYKAEKTKNTSIISTEAMKIASLVKTQVYKTRTR